MKELKKVITENPVFVVSIYFVVAAVVAITLGKYV